LLLLPAAFMDGNALDILQQDSFLNLSESAVRAIISRDSFCADEVDIFRAVARWARANPEQDVRGILAEIRLSLLSITASHIRPPSFI
jgi:BTB/POZ domain-containing protein 9